MSMSKDLLAKLNFGNEPVLVPEEKESMNVVIPSIADMFTKAELDLCNLEVTITGLKNNSYSRSQDVLFFDKASGDVMIAVESRGTGTGFGDSYDSNNYKPVNPDLVKASIVEALAHCVGGPDVNKARLTMFARIFGTLTTAKFEVVQTNLNLGARAFIKASFANHGVAIQLLCVLNSPRSPLLIPFPDKFGAIIRRWDNNNFSPADWNGGRLERVHEGKTTDLITFFEARHRNDTEEAKDFEFPAGRVHQLIRSFMAPIHSDPELIDWCIAYIDKWCAIKGGAEIFSVTHEPYYGDKNKVSLELHAVTPEGEVFRINL